jgi:glycosyltransferase involved in cell wall biosynthesis
MGFVTRHHAVPLIGLVMNASLESRNDAGTQNQPRFSVISVTWNNLNGLVETWRSLEAQTLDSFEWVVVDGGSSDGTVDWLESLADPRITWVSEPDRGIYDAMNRGIDRSNGQFAIFMNGGDTFSTPWTLARVDAHQRRWQWKWGYGIMRYVDGNRDVLGLEFAPRFRLLEFRLGTRIIGHQSAFFGADILAAVGHYREDMAFAGDQEFMLRAARVAEPSAIPELIADFQMGGVSDGVPADYFVQMSHRIRLANGDAIAKSRVLDRAATGVLGAGVRLVSKARRQRSGGWE